jgi:hypothetical protein
VFYYKTVTLKINVMHKVKQKNVAQYPTDFFLVFPFQNILCQEGGTQMTLIPLKGSITFVFFLQQDLPLLVLQILAFSNALDK